MPTEPKPLHDPPEHPLKDPPDKPILGSASPSTETPDTEEQQSWYDVLDADALRFVFAVAVVAAVIGGIFIYAYIFMFHSYTSPS